ncbi:hypothetical protein BST81_24320 [Leptolyngbya sp. 'hensonii']|uniref:hypothetical protein n=1 Tax=Leptolyngbya sp. 'hensonii' TaxID=1922337 RepID=UPI00094F530F|nr:hypothetical protein [Leptolyngbya sp. 'hensonii']OLP15846.1 hypothetical protein BST81_24320 [Leptolyngbya sp. 'hensonii']
MTQRNQAIGIILGFFLVIGINSLILALSGGIVYATCYLTPTSGNYYRIPSDFFLVIAVLFIAIFLSIGVAQLLYVIPLILWLQRRQHWGMMKGVIAGATITAFLNASPFVVSLFIR